MIPLLSILRSQRDSLEMVWCGSRIELREAVLSGNIFSATLIFLLVCADIDIVKELSCDELLSIGEDYQNWYDTLRNFSLSKQI